LKLTRHLVITGKVQGVWYRESMRLEAERLGITGWVRNQRDGSVEAVVQGEEDAVEALIRWAWEGPPEARVARIDSQPDSGEYSQFERRPTA
jgi:acylphosphatase